MTRYSVTISSLGQHGEVGDGDIFYGSGLQRHQAAAAFLNALDEMDSDDALDLTITVDDSWDAA